MRRGEPLRFWADELARDGARRLGLATNDYDRERFRRVGAIAQGIAETTIEATFARERHERDHSGRSVPLGGYADVGATPSENRRREPREGTDTPVFG